MNHLEQLAAEWYEYQGYFVRRNVLVGKLSSGGWECELDVVAFHPAKMHLVHIEPTMDTHSWSKRESRYLKKFQAGRRYIPFMFAGMGAPESIDQIALLGLGSKKNHQTLAGGKVMLISDLLAEVTDELKLKRVETEIVPELFPLLRTIQFVCQHQSKLFAREP